MKNKVSYYLKEENKEIYLTRFNLEQVIKHFNKVNGEFKVFINDKLTNDCCFGLNVRYTKGYKFCSVQVYPRYVLQNLIQMFANIGIDLDSLGVNLGNMTEEQVNYFIRSWHRFIIENNYYDS